MHKICLFFIFNSKKNINLNFFYFLFFRDKNSKSKSAKYSVQQHEISLKDLEGKTEEEQEMMKMMGFGEFDSTKVSINKTSIKFKHLNSFFVLIFKKG